MCSTMTTTALGAKPQRLAENVDGVVYVNDRVSDHVLCRFRELGTPSALFTKHNPTVSCVISVFFPAPCLRVILPVHNI